MSNVNPTETLANAAKSKTSRYFYSAMYALIVMYQSDLFSQPIHSLESYDILRGVGSLLILFIIAYSVSAMFTFLLRIHETADREGFEMLGYLLVKDKMNVAAGILLVSFFGLAVMVSTGLIPALALLIWILPVVSYLFIIGALKPYLKLLKTQKKGY